MARPYRIQGENCFYHITSRGDDRKKVFVTEADHDKFLKYIKVAKEKFGFHFYAYCLMGNHYHLLLETSQPNLSRIMQYLNTSYTIYYNVKRGRCGHVFQGRFKSILVERDSYFLELTRYIHLNPVRVKIVEQPEEYKWSSYNAYLRGKADGYVDIDRVKQFLSMDMSRYRGFVESGIKGCPNPFANVCAGSVLGGVSFVNEKLNQIRKEVEARDFAHKRAIKNATEPERIIAVVAGYYKTTAELMIKSTSRPMTAKKVAIYLLRYKTGLTNEQIGKIFGMKFSAVSKSALDIERQIEHDREVKKTVERIVSRFEV